jgi:hypothetical protein
MTGSRRGRGIFASGFGRRGVAGYVGTGTGCTRDKYSLLSGAPDGCKDLSESQLVSVRFSFL